MGPETATYPGLIKAISLWQPWASFMVLLREPGLAEKAFETRSWPTHYRGPLAIHASKKLDMAAYDVFRLVPWVKYVMHKHGYRTLEDLPRGCILGTVKLIGCHKTDDIAGHLSKAERDLGDYSRGRYAWQCINPVRLALPIPCRGHQGLWDWDPHELDERPSEGLSRSPVPAPSGDGRTVEEALEQARDQEAPRRASARGRR